MKFNLKLSKKAMFSNKEIILFIIPVLFKQLLIASLSIEDMLMISRLPNNETVIAAIA